MLLAKDRILGETMIRMVPSGKQEDSLIDFDPNHSLVEQQPIFSDFDLDLVDPFSPPPSSNSDFQLGPPSPSDNILSPNLTTDLDTLTMFSPDSKLNFQQTENFSPGNYNVPSASPISLAPSSPYSPRGNVRFSSTDSAQTSSSSTVNLKENLEEFAELQRKVRMENQSVNNAGNDNNMEEVLSMVMDDLFEHVRKEIKSQCAVLNISPDPNAWSQADVTRWLRYKMQELKIPSSQPVFQWAANFEGPGFLQITEQEFKLRLPQGGDQVYSALEMWRNTSANFDEQHQQQQQQQELYHVDDVLEMIDNDHYQPPPQYSEVVTKSRPPPSFEDHMATSSRMPSIDELLQQQETLGAPPPYPGTSVLTPLQPPMSHGSSTQDNMTEDEAEVEDDSTDPRSPKSNGGGPIRGSSSNIHLWQFVKELLNQPVHSGCIHWVDRDQGIFKIVDSVRVAELWGKRKNRPAMNFDKLSRSLRQYYKKGIMKKTSRPQRLVYQFCSPYHQ